MAQRDDARRRQQSPYSRTGLFPWGSSYDVPARPDPAGHSTQTPCHLRTVVLTSAEDQQLPCPACGRVWRVHVRPDATPPVARWTA